MYGGTRMMYWVTGMLIGALMAASRFIAPPYYQYRAIAHLEGLGGRVIVRDGGPEWVRRCLGDNVMRAFGRVVYVAVVGCKEGDEAARQIARLSGVSIVTLEGSHITNDGVRYLAQLEHVKELDLAHTDVSDIGLADVVRLASLRQLHLDGTAITDRGIRHIAGMPELAVLSIRSTAVTDFGIVELRRLARLSLLDLRDTRTSEWNTDVLRRSVRGLCVLSGDDGYVAARPLPVQALGAVK